MMGRSTINIYSQDNDHALRSYTEAIDKHTVLHMLYCILTPASYLSLWLCNHNTMYNYTYSILCYSYLYYATPLNIARSDLH